jgi:glycosyltransferase involved in cell wall biosynthesis
VWYRALFRHLGRRALRVLTVSEFSRSRLAARLGVPAQRIAVLPNGADHLESLAEDPGLAARAGLAGQPFLMAVGSASPSKNLPRLVKAFARSGLSGRVLLVVIGGTNAEVFASEDLPTVEGVRYLGPIDDAGLKALYGQALALVQPSLYEGFGLPPLEAMACGCAVAAAKAAALPEVCGDAAIYFDPLSEQDIADAMQRLAEDESLRSSLRCAGRARAARFSWHAAARQLRELVRCAA